MYVPTKSNGILLSPVFAELFHCSVANGLKRQLNLVFFFVVCSNVNGYQYILISSIFMYMQFCKNYFFLHKNFLLSFSYITSSIN